MSRDQTRWRGEGWQVSIDGERTGSGAVRVEQAQARPAREGRACRRGDGSCDPP